MKFTLLVVLTLAGLGAAACTHKPAYSDINANAAGAGQNRTNSNAPDATAESSALGASPGSSPDSVPASAGGAVPPAQTAPAAQAPIPVPAFMDLSRGEARDLPNYPRAVRQNVRYGPNDDNEMFSAALHTSDSMDKVAAFYDDAIKRNGWKVSSRIVDPEYSEWIVKKNEDDQGKVVVQKEQQSRKGFLIVIARTGKTPKKPAAAATPPPKKQS